MARPKLGEGDTVRLHMVLPDELMNRITEWRYDNRLPSSSEAIRQLIERALEPEAERIVAEASNQMEKAA